VFVNAFNLHERGHAESLSLLTRAHDQGAPIILPTLALVEIASAIARATNDETAAAEFAQAVEGLPEVTLIPLTPAVARNAAELAATYRLRSADAVYAAVARRYATTLVTRDRQQHERASAAVECVTPEAALGVEC
jgi:predicted nucleic acid-binding protein